MTPEKRSSITKSVEPSSRGFSTKVRTPLKSSVAHLRSMCVPLALAGRQSVARLSRSALAITDTELKVIAALAIIGLSSRPSTG